MTEQSEPFIDPLLGSRIGEYRIDDRIGEGGICVVYRAQQVSTGKVVALKILRRTWIDDPQTPKRFLREARISTSLTNPNTVAVYDSGEADGTLYLAMELLEGESLAAFLRTQRPMPPRLAAEILDQVCLSLMDAHSKGVVHRDLKPENIFVTQRADGARLVKVLDYGLARVVESSEDAPVHTVLTRIGTIMGTPAYMSPEQARGEPVDARSDLYSIGVMLYEMLTGARPFSDPNPRRLIERLKTEPLPVMHRAGMAPRLESLARRLLEKDPDARLPDAAAVHAVLNDFLTTEAPSGPSLQAAGGDRSREDEATFPEVAAIGADDVVSEEPADTVIVHDRPREASVPSLARMLEPTPPPRSASSARTVWLVGALVALVIAGGVAALPRMRGQVDERDPPATRRTSQEPAVGGDSSPRAAGPTRRGDAPAPPEPPPTAVVAAPEAPREGDDGPPEGASPPSPPHEPAATPVPGAPGSDDSWVGMFHCERGPLRLERRGDRVLGFFGRQSEFGRLWGEIHGDSMEFRWAMSNAPDDPTARGRGLLHVAPGSGGDRLEGTFGYRDRSSGGGLWTAIRDAPAP